jgi:uncharacterized cupredoxin-like copper-binding protein
MKMFSNARPFLLTALVAATGSVSADAGHSSKSGPGSPADAGDATRTIEVGMTDNRYSLSEIDVAKGEVIRFVIRNRGQLVHEFNIGTPRMHASHQDEMLMMMQSGQMSPTKLMHGRSGKMGHDDPNSIHLAKMQSGKMSSTKTMSGHGGDMEHDDQNSNRLAKMQSGKMSSTKTMSDHGRDMGHDDPNSILLNPGESKELVWRFGEQVDGLEFACNVPGHYQAGMVGRFRSGS